MSEQELVANETVELEAALSDDPPAQEPEQQAEPEKGSQDRDEHGRFKAKAEQPEPVAQVEQPAAEKPADMVPVWRLNEVSQSKREAAARAEAAERRIAEYERRIQEMERAQKPQEQAQAPDMYQDPDAWREWVLQQAEQKASAQADALVTRKFIERDLMRAKEQHGELFDKAYAALEAELASGNQSTRMRVVNAVSPGDELVKWYKQNEFLQEVKDPEQWRQQQIEAIRAQVMEELKAGTPPRQVTKIPPSLSKVTASSGSDDGSSLSDKEQHASIFQ